MKEDGFIGVQKSACGGAELPKIYGGAKYNGIVFRGIHRLLFKIHRGDVQPAPIADQTLNTNLCRSVLRCIGDQNFHAVLLPFYIMIEKHFYYTTQTTVCQVTFRRTSYLLHSFLCFFCKKIDFLEKL